MARSDIAALLALSSALCIAIGDVLQQRAAQRIAERSVGHAALFVELLRDSRWRIGLLLLAASIALQAAALSLGSVLLVQALLMLSLLFALPVNAKLSVRAVGRGEWVWAGVLTAAVIVVVVIGNPQAGHTDAPLRIWAAVAAVLGPVLIGCAVAGRVRGGAPAAVLYGFVSGSLWGVFAVLTKEVVAQLDHGLPATLGSPEVYALALCAAGGFVGSQLAFRAGPLTASMPALQMSQPVMAALLGLIVLGETLNTGPAGVVTICLAVAVMTAAVIQLARVDAVSARRRTRNRLRAHAS